MNIRLLTSCFRPLTTVCAVLSGAVLSGAVLSGAVLLGAAALSPALADPPTSPPASAAPPAAPLMPPAAPETQPTAPPPSISGLDNTSASGADTAPALSGKIARIIIRGNTHISTEAIRAVLSQKIGSPYNPTAADRDRDQIKGMGFFNGEVVLNASRSQTGGVDLAYIVTENPVVKRIVFTANTADGKPTIPADKLKSLMDTREGQVLNTNTLVRDIDKLFNHQTGYVSQQGYIMDVSADINVDPNNGVLTIPLVEAYIQSIQIKGNKKTKSVVITREMRSRPGQVLNQNTLQKELTRVYNLGLFDQVGPVDLQPTDVGKVIVTIPVTEKRSGQVSVGVGYSSTAKLVGRAELAENNFRGLGERVSIQGEVGGISSESSIELGFFEPYIDKRHTSLSVDLYNKVIYRFSSSIFGSATSPQTGSTSNYSEIHKGGSLSVNRPVNDFTSFGLSARTESVTSANVDVPLTGSFIRQDGTVSAIGAQLANNTKDQDFAPASGGFRSLSYELGVASTSTASNAPSPLAPGRHDFGKFGIDLRQYISLQGPRKLGNIKEPKRVLAVRLLAGTTTQNIPFFEQYFLGGADSLRGVQTDRYWGNNLLLFQSEVRIPVGKGDNFQFVGLADVGDAWGSIYQAPGLQQHSSLSLNSDYGVGIRLVTPIGPIRVDYAIPTGGGSGQTQFSIGQSF